MTDEELRSVRSLSTTGVKPSTEITTAGTGNSRVYDD